MTASAHSEPLVGALRVHMADLSLSLFLGSSSCSRGTSITPTTSSRSSSSSRRKGATAHRYPSAGVGGWCRFPSAGAGKARGAQVPV